MLRRGSIRERSHGYAATCLPVDFLVIEGVCVKRHPCKTRCSCDDQRCDRRCNALHRDAKRDPGRTVQLSDWDDIWPGCLEGHDGPPESFRACGRLRHLM